MSDLTLNLHYQMHIISSIFYSNNACMQGMNMLSFEYRNREELRAQG